MNEQPLIWGSSLNVWPDPDPNYAGYLHSLRAGAAAKWEQYLCEDLQIRRAWMRSWNTSANQAGADLL